MGADLITATLILPEAPKADQVVVEHTERLEKALAEEPDDKAEELLLSLDVDFEALSEVVGGSWGDRPREKASNILKWLKENALEEGKISNFTARDLVWHHLDIKNQETGRPELIHIATAGELSWGDEPEGYGYQTISRMQILGYGEALDRATWELRGVSPAKGETHA